MTTADAEPAPAKINLTLHVTGRRPDGYHLLDSLVVFAGVGDRLEAEPASGLSLSLSGPFADTLGASADNLVLKAAAALSDANGAPGAALHLAKRLPVAAGIGGGSSDAAAALRLLSRLWRATVPDGLARRLGADVPVCLAAPGPQRIRGTGERLEPVPPLPEAHLVLANPRLPVATAEVFRRLDPATLAPAPALPARFPDFAALVGWLVTARNDLARPAIAVAPAIAGVLDALADAPFAAMSGSGATCFALYPDAASAAAKAETLRRETSWWVAAAPVLS